jgi:hypothetical protein
METLLFSRQAFNDDGVNGTRKGNLILCAKMWLVASGFYGCTFNVKRMHGLSKKKKKGSSDFSSDSFLIQVLQLQSQLC